MANKLRNIAGMTFGLLTAIDRCGFKGKHAAWRVRCACGTEKILAVNDITRKRGIDNRSCGCKQRARVFIHGMKGHRAWRIFKGMKQRCNNPNNPGYAIYGGRGIRVLWGSFAEFWQDMGPTYSPGMEIDRIDNNGHYCSGNCRWTTRLVNVNNRRNTIRHDGETLTEIASKTNIPRSTLYSRFKSGRKVVSDDQ